MNKCFGKLGLAALLCCTGVPATWLRGQDTIGVVAEAVKPDVADKLKLSEEQRTKFQQLLKRRQSELLDLSQKERALPPDQRSRLRNEFRIETEQMGYAILEVEQRSKLEQIRVERLGMLSLAEPGIASVLNLADWQKAKVNELVARANASARSADGEKIRTEVERGIRSEISESQWATWQVLAGKSTNALGQPQPPERKPEPTVANAPRGAAGAGGGTATNPATAGAMPVEAVKLTMNFQGMPWNEVLKWMCDQADLSLKADTMPPGSFTYRDTSRKYSVGEALDIMSASLLGNGYSLIRRDRLLMVVDLEAPMVKNYVKELAEFVPLQQLDSRGDFELVKCLFVLQRLNPDDAKKEIEQLLSLQGSVVSLPSTGQIQVIDTAGVMRAIRALVERAESPDSVRGSSITAIPLKHITANEVLDVARTLLGLPEGANSNQEISISSDTFGNTLFVNAKKVEDVQKLRDLVLHLDQAPTPTEQGVVGRESSVFQTHDILGSDADLAFRVLSQRLASETDVRMELDKETNKLVVQARPSVHKEIDDLLRLLGGQGSDFEVIELKMDTQTAIAAIEKFFGLSKSGTADPTQPIIDGDAIMRRLYVKATPKQLEQIKTLIEKMEASAANNNLGENVRVIPLPSRKMERTIEQVERLWMATKKRNRIRVVTPSENRDEGSFQQRSVVPPESQDSSSDEASSQKSTSEPVQDSKRGSQTPGKPQREEAPVNPAASERPKTTQLHSSPKRRSGKLVSWQQSGTDANQQIPKDKDQNSQSQDDSEPADIVLMPGPGGLIITSSDTAALAEFDRMLRMMLDSSALSSAEPTFYYLKYRKAADAKILLESILSGTSSSSSGGGGGGGLIGDMMSEVGGGLIGSLLGSGSGGIKSSGASMTTGDVIINADPQLNILVIRANNVDLETCDQLLRVIDQPDSIIPIRTWGDFAVIEVLSQDAETVAAEIKGLLGDRVEGSGGGGGGGQNRGGAPDPREFLQALTGGGGRNRGGNNQISQTKIAISVDKKTNSLLVTGAPQDIEFIRQIVERVDAAGQVQKRPSTLYH